jgi:ribonuclease E
MGTTANIDVEQIDFDLSLITQTQVVVAQDDDTLDDDMDDEDMDDEDEDMDDDMDDEDGDVDSEG